MKSGIYTTRIYYFLCLCVLLCAVFFRFYNYQQRWGLAYDQAHDAIIADYALSTSRIPLVGPFSSAGPFQTGGEWYWIIMLASRIPFAGYMTPWISLTVVSVLFVFLIIVFGRGLVGKMFALLVGFFAAISPSQIGQAVNLTNQSPLPFLSLLSLWSGVTMVKTRKTSSAFWLGFFSSFAATVHLQGISLGVVLLVSHLFSGVSTRRIMATIVGAVLPLLPLIYFDVLYGGINSKGFLVYLLNQQYQVSYEVLGRRWLTFVSVTIPQEWARVVGGNQIVTMILALLLLVIIVVELKKQMLTKEFLVIFTSFIGMLVIVRYTRTPLFSSYFNFLHPFIFVITVYVLHRVVLFKKLFGIFLIVIVVVSTTLVSIKEIHGGENSTYKLVTRWIDSLETLLPNRSYRVYDLAYGYRDKSVPFVLIASNYGYIRDDGYPIGIGIATAEKPVNAPVLFGDYQGYQFFDLSTFSGQLLEQEQWININPSEIYKNTQEWPKK